MKFLQLPKEQTKKKKKGIVAYRKEKKNMAWRFKIQDAWNGNIAPFPIKNKANRKNGHLVIKLDFLQHTH